MRYMCSKIAVTCHHWRGTNMREPIRLRPNLLLAFCAVNLALLLSGCNEHETATVGQTFGPKPTLVEPEKSLVPTINVAKAIGWPAGGKPTAADGMAVNALATALDHPRRLYVLPNGDVLVAETTHRQGLTKRKVSRAGSPSW